MILAETVGALALLAGFATRFNAAAIARVMVGAILLWHLPNGFYMNWGGSQKGEGVEFFSWPWRSRCPWSSRGRAPMPSTVW